MNIQLTDEQKVKIYSDRELYPVMRQILLRDNEIDQNKEHFWVCGLATNCTSRLSQRIFRTSPNGKILHSGDVND